MSPPPLVLIRTLPLSAGNYGGIIQAWAMQQALRSIGLEAVTDVSSGRALREPFTNQVKSLAKRVVLDLPFVSVDNSALTEEHLKQKLNARLNSFVDNEIATVSLYSRSQVDSSVLRNVEGFLVGSDQVWRARWSDVTSYLFDFLPTDDVRPRVAYAASFGRDDLDEYGRELKHETAALAHRLTAVSVREHSGVSICAEEWGIEAETHVDPTMLLPAESYARLSRSAAKTGSEGTLVSYVLDESHDSRQQIARVAAATGLGITSLTAERPTSVPTYRSDPERYNRASVEEWLAAFASAEYVVTDSFHGTVFAILNNKPFIAIVNRSRGASRFDSLLSRFGLTERLVEPNEPISDELVGQPINWPRVNELIDEERERGVSFLRRAFASALNRN